MVVPLVPPEPRPCGAGPIAAATAKSEILDLALPPKISHVSQAAWIGATKDILRRQSKPALSVEPGPPGRTNSVEPKSRLVNEAPCQLRGAEMAGGADEAPQRGRQDPRVTGSPV